MRFICIVSTWLLLCVGASAQVGQIPSWPPNQPTFNSSCCVLDSISTGLQAAYSTRRLRSAYGGSALAVTRASDHTARNIGFVSNVLDTSTLATFCSATTCVVTTWYDQSINLLDETYIEANSPVIYASGAVESINSKPAISFVAATPTTLKNASLSGNPSLTRYHSAVAALPIAGNQTIFSAENTGGFQWRINATGNQEMLKSQTDSIGTSSGTLTTNVGAIVEAFYNSSTGIFSFFINGAASGSGTKAETLIAGTANIGTSRGSDEPFNGLIGELIIYDQTGGISGADQSTIEGNQRAYWGTP